MSHLTFLPGEPDPTLPRFLPSFGLDVTHLYLPETMTGDGWGDQAGGLTLNKSGTGVAKVGTENGVSYVRGDGSVRFISPNNALPAAELKTTLLVFRPEETDTADGAAYLFNGGSIGISSNAGTKSFASAPASSTIILPTYNQWYCVALVASGSAPVRLVANNQEAIAPDTTAATVGNTIRLLGGSSSFRAGKLALALTSSSAVSTDQLQKTVFPRVREWLAGLDFAAN